MNLLILGGFGKLGQVVYRELAPLPTMNVTLFGRQHNDGKQYPAAKVIYGDATNVDDLVSALEGIDVVFSTLGPFDVEKFAVPLIKAMDLAGVKRLYWSTQFQIVRDDVTPAMFELAQSFGFDETVEQTYVENQKAGAALIEASDLDYTLLMCHFFIYDDAIQKAIVEPGAQTISGGPISLTTLGVALGYLLQRPANYSRQGVMISAKQE